MMEWLDPRLILDLISWALLVGGGFFVFVGGVGVLRMPDMYTRLHAASLTDTLGSMMVLAGLMVQGGLSLITAKLIVILIFLLFTGPTSSYALANAALMAGVKPKLARNVSGKPLPEGELAPDEDGTP